MWTNITGFYAGSVYVTGLQFLYFMCLVLVVFLAGLLQPGESVCSTNEWPHRRRKESLQMQFLTMAVPDCLSQPFLKLSPHFANHESSSDIK